MEKYVIANLKMNMISSDVSAYLKEINDKIDNKNVIICPTNIYMPYFLKQEYSVGIQNIYYETLGSYTGEVSAKQAKSMGIDYAIVGHSERRLLFKETDIDINKKIIECLKNKVNVILCIGETLEEREMFRTTKALNRQINRALDGIKDFSHIIIAYEPVWSIGSGKILENSEIEEMVLYIKSYIKEKYNQDIKALYGGSVNDKNIKQINSIKALDGVLVGGASLESKKLLKIIEVVAS